MSHYTVFDLAWLIANPAREGAYTEALARADLRGAVVVDLGAGFGYFALRAAALGARMVYAIEPAPALALGPALARELGLADRIRFLNRRSDQVQLPEPADVVISDLRGFLPLNGNHLETIVDVRRRFLRPGGLLIARKDDLVVSLVTEPSVWHRQCRPWANVASPMKLSEVEGHLVHSYNSVRLKPDEVLDEGVVWASIDYHTVEKTRVDGEAEFALSRSATAVGLALWFRADLGGGVTFSTGPGSAVDIYRQVFLPWPMPRTLSAGDVVRVRLAANPMGERHAWTWRTWLKEPGQVDRLLFDQNTFQGDPLDKDSLRRRAPGTRIRADNALRIDSFILRGLEEGRTVGQIGERLVEQFPDQIADLPRAVARVGDLAERYAAEIDE